MIKNHIHLHQLIVMLHGLMGFINIAKNTPEVRNQYKNDKPAPAGDVSNRPHSSQGEATRPAMTDRATAHACRQPIAGIGECAFII
jgi:hypothetical protein